MNGSTSNPIRSVQSAHRRKSHGDQIAEADSEDIAYRLYRYGRLQRTTLESRILAGIPSDRISQLMDIQLPSVETYRRLFCDIEDRRQATDSVLAAIQRSGRDCPDRVGPVGVALRELAYLGGPLVVEQLLPALSIARQILKEPTIVWREQVQPSREVILLLIRAIQAEQLSVDQWLYLSQRVNDYERLQQQTQKLESILEHGVLGPGETPLVGDGDAQASTEKANRLVKAIKRALAA